MEMMSWNKKKTQRMHSDEHLYTFDFWTEATDEEIKKGAHCAYGYADLRAWNMLSAPKIVKREVKKHTFIYARSHITLQCAFEYGHTFRCRLTVIIFQCEWNGDDDEPLTHKCAFMMSLWGTWPHEFEYIFHMENGLLSVLWWAPFSRMRKTKKKIV